jgi:hypothetical protein
MSNDFRAAYKEIFLKEFIKQKIFTLNNIEAYHISPYCEVEVVEDKVYIYRRDNDCGYEFGGMSTEIMLELISKLIVGIDEKELADFLSEHLQEDDPNNWLQFCIQNGIIE